MRLLFASLLITLVLGVANAAQCHQIGSWQKVADAPTQVSEASCAQIGGTLYTLMGFGAWTTNVLRATADHYALDLNTGVWTQKTAVPFAGVHAQPANNGSHIFIAGGFVGDYPGTLTKNVSAYSIADNSWSSLPNLLVDNAAGSLVFIDGKLYYFSGLIDQNVSTADVYMLDLASLATGWQKLAGAFPDPRNQQFAARVRPDLVVFPGGDHGNANPTDIGTVVGFVPSTQEYTTLADMPSPRSHGDMVISNGRVLVVGGRNNQATAGTILSDVVEYSPDEDKWYTIGTLPAQRFSTCAAVYTNATGTFMVIAKGGLDYNQIIKEVWVAPVTVSCTYTTTTPAATTPSPTTGGSTTSVITTGTSTTSTGATTGTPVTSGGTTTSAAASSAISSASSSTTAASSTTTSATQVSSGLLHTAGGLIPHPTDIVMLLALILAVIALVQ